MNRLTVNGFARLGRLLIGLVAGMIVAGTLSQAMTERVSASPGSPVWILNAISPGQACSNWRDDHSIFHGTTPFSYYWSGQPQWWNYPPADACWHNDEVSSSWWRAIDVGYPKKQSRLLSIVDLRFQYGAGAAVWHFFLRRCRYSDLDAQRKLRRKIPRLASGSKYVHHRNNVCTAPLRTGRVTPLAADRHGPGP